MIHYGDITQIKGSDVPVVDIVTGGSPCQDLSVAGKRAGLAGERSGLFMEQIRIIKEMREHDRQSRRSDGRADEYIRPRYMVWENVPGAFSSNGGKDFHAVLEETAKVAERDASIPGFEGKWPSAGCIMGNGWSIAWRVHDAQFWGVPQRRKRIALVADFGGETAPEILFERKGLSGDIAQGGKEGERTSGNAERCAGETGTEPIVLESNQNHATIQTNGISTALPASAGMGGGYVPMVALTTEITPKIDDDGVAFSLRSRDYKDPQSVCCFEPGAASRVGGHVYEDISGTVRANAGDNQQAVCYGIDQQGGKGMAGYAEDVSPTMASDSHGTPHAVCYGISPYDSNGMKSDNPHAGIYKAETARTLDPNGGNPACNQGGIAVVSVENHPADSRVKICDDGKVQALTSRMGTGGGNVPMVMEQPTCLTRRFSDVNIYENGITPTLEAGAGEGGNNMPMVMETYQKTTGSLCASGYDKLGTQEAANDMYVVQSAMAMQAIGEYKQSEAASSLKMRDYKDATDLVVSYGLDRASFNQGMNAQYDFAVDEEKIGTQVAKGPGAVASFYPQMKAESQCWREDDVSNTLVNGTNPGYQNGICTPVVRRLTPIECERLQGYPDHWTDIGDWVDSKGKTHKGDSDSPRYKALGNSIALPFWSWMAGRMVKYLKHGCTMASLFDGIGGFPFVFLGWGCEPVWASEIRVPDSSY